MGSQSATEWINGGDLQVGMVQLAPGLEMSRGAQEQRSEVVENAVEPSVLPASATVLESAGPRKVTSPAAPTPASVTASSIIESPSASPKQTTENSVPMLSEPVPPPVVSSIPNSSAASPSTVTTNPLQSTAQPSKPGLSSTYASPATPTPTSTTIAPIATSSVRGAPFNPRWSRKFLIGKTPLKPDYSGLHSLSATMSAGCEMLKVSYRRI